jgi:hypothetical protein
VSLVAQLKQLENAQQSSFILYDEKENPPVMLTQIIVFWRVISSGLKNLLVI